MDGRIIYNSFGRPYLLDEASRRRLRPYLGVVPDGAYLVLGNQLWDSTDSRKLGLIDHTSLLGLVTR